MSTGAGGRPPYWPTRPARRPGWSWCWPAGSRTGTGKAASGRERAQVRHRRDPQVAGYERDGRRDPHRIAVQHLGPLRPPPRPLAPRQRQRKARLSLGGRSAPERTAPQRTAARSSAQAATPGAACPRCPAIAPGCSRALGCLSSAVRPRAARRLAVRPDRPVPEPRRTPWDRSLPEPRRMTRDPLIPEPRRMARGCLPPEPHSKRRCPRDYPPETRPAGLPPADRRHPGRPPEEHHPWPRHSLDRRSHLWLPGCPARR